MSRLLVFAILIVNLPQLGNAAEGGDVASRLIRQLGDDSFQARQQAMRELSSLGSKAIPVLRAAVTSDLDLESQQRAERLLDRLELAEHMRLVERLEVEPSIENASRLPGWPEFASTVGTDTAGLRLFAEMQTAEPELFLELSRSSGSFSRAFATRAVEIQHEFGYRLRNMPPAHRPSQSEIANLCAMFHIGAMRDLRIDQRTAEVVTSYARYELFQRAMLDDTMQSGLRRVVGGWVRRPETEALFDRLEIAVHYELEEGIDLAKEVIAKKVTLRELPNAILLVGKLGSPEHLPLLEAELLRLKKANVLNAVHVSDVALACLWHLVGERPEDHGFEHLERQDLWLFTPKTVIFTNSDDRAAALRQWVDYRNRNDLPDVN